MAGSGSEKRQRQVTLKARFTDAEAALIREQADRAGVSVASVIRYAVLDQTPLRASRTPSVSEEAAARLLGKIGQLATALRGCADAGNPGKTDPRIEAAHRDIAEMRVALFQALGREP
jgi:Mobilization protein NikA